MRKQSEQRQWVETKKHTGRATAAVMNRLRAKVAKNLKGYIGEVWRIRTTMVGI
jgi:hypothetical protein